MDSSNQVFVNTCGVCETIVIETEIADHSCVAGFSNIFINYDSKYFYPQCENGDIIRKSALPGGMEGIVVDPTISQQDTDEPVSEATNSFNQPSNLDERLIEEVRRREPLYNFRLPLAQRGRKQTKHMWQDISTELNGEISADGAAKRWKSLRDTFMKIIAEERQPSGSGRVSRWKKWRFYD
ncbi:histone H3 [Lasius niger]|uniref:Histone H3 n=2 Tax=Lasius TaxID=488720 RepID=A0A0J7KHB5_LASNI|nr:histone H3 [Lasius niger]